MYAIRSYYEDRHVGQVELPVAVERLQLMLDLDLAPGALRQLQRVEGVAVLAVMFRLVHGGIGIGDQLRDGVPILRALRDADAGRHRVGSHLEPVAVLDQGEQLV